MKVSVFVQTIPKRIELARSLEASLRSSDVDSYEVLVQKPEHNAWDHFFRVFEAMRDSDADLVIRLEDDAIINPYLKYNCERWPVIERPEFGAGWLYSSPSNIVDYIYRRRLRPLCKKRFLDGTVGNLFRRSDMPWILERCQRWAARRPAGYAYDFCLSDVMYSTKRELWLHDPPLVEHNVEVRSSMGHPVTPRCSTMGAFNAKFRVGTRPAPRRAPPAINALPSIARKVPPEIVEDAPKSPTAPVSRIQRVIAEHRASIPRGLDSTG